jgi:hypothetical protein
VGHAPLVCESDSEAPPIARTAHAVHCACATCARVTRVGWSAVSQSRAVPLAVATTSTQAPLPPAHGLGAALRWCNTNSITCGRGGGQGRPGPLRTGGGGRRTAEDTATTQKRRKKPSFPRFIWWRKTRACAHQPQWCMAPPRPGPCLPLLKFKLSTHGACRELVW